MSIKPGSSRYLLRLDYAHASQVPDSDLGAVFRAEVEVDRVFNAQFLRTGVVDPLWTVS